MYAPTRFSAWLTLLLLLAPIAALAATQQGRDSDPDSGLPRWQLRDGALSIELIARPPDQTRAFFIGRGFDAASADRVARACVFQAIVRNAGTPAEGGPALGIDLARWRVMQSAGATAPRLESDWQAGWDRADLSPAARVAFRWALFPTQQVFRPGDYNWGMIAFGPAPGEPFELDLVWQEDEVERSARLVAIECPADRVATE